MAVGKDTLWERFLSPIVRLLIDEAALQRFERSIDWPAQTDRFVDRHLTYPEYYRTANFHGIENGYLTSSAAVTYDPITQYVLPPSETWVRQSLIDAVRVRPRRILDLGCGTGSMTVMLKQAFPEAEVVGLDLSPYMLVMADRKATATGLNIEWRHGSADRTPFADANFDLVTVALLFHETPPAISQAILHEAFRLLKSGGQAIVLDGSQKSMRHTDWLMDIFEEPYIRDYAEGNVDAWMGAAGFERVRTEELWWIHQLTQGIVPVAVETPTTPEPGEPVAAPAFA